MAERFLVIGSNSFSGATFVAEALAASALVVGISRSEEPAAPLLPYKWKPHQGFQFHQLNLNHDLDEIVSVVNSFRPQFIVNFAAQSMVAQSWERPEHWYATNVMSMIRLHERLRTCDFLQRYVQVSTPEVYGATSGVVREDAPYNPSTPYAVSKAACDMNLLAYVKAYAFPVVFTRAANVCGPGQPLYRIIPRTILSILNGEKLRLQGGGRSVRSFLHARDMADGTLRVTRRGKPGEIFHLSTDERISIRDLVHRICARLGADFDDVVEIVEGRLGQDAAYLLDWSRARNDLGWKPRCSLDVIIRETIEWMREMWEQIRDLPRDYVHKP